MPSSEPPDDSLRRIEESVEGLNRKIERVRRRGWFRGVREAILGIVAATALFVALEKPPPLPPLPPPPTSVEQSIQKLNTATIITQLKINLVELRDSAEDLNAETIDSIKDKVLELSKLPCAAELRAEIEDTVKELHLDELKHLPKGKRLDKKEIQNKLWGLTVKLFKACANSLYAG